MLLNALAKPISGPDRTVLGELDWSEAAAMWNNNQLGQLHDWLNERWARIIRDSVMGAADPEGEFLQALAFAVLALFFTQNHNQEGALLMADDAIMALNRFRPRYMGVAIEPIFGALEELRPLLCGLAADDPCPMMPFTYPKFEYFSLTP